MTPDVTGDVPQDYFKAVTYTGNGVDLPNDGQQITTGMQPDLVWIKQRNGTNQHSVFDSVRGPGMILGTNSTSGDSGWQTHVNNGNYYFLHEFNATGFKVNSSAGSSTNGSGSTFASWSWKAGGAPSGSNIYMKDGTGYTNSTSDKATVFGSASNYTITPTSASIGVKQGFGIYTFTASTGNTKLPHGLGKAPEFVIIKSTDTDSTNWVATFPALGDDLYLNTSGARINGASAGTYFQTTADADAITFGLQSTTYSNKPSLEYVVYAFTSIPGYSKFGSYTGNGSADGPMVYCGFRPAWVMVKCIESSAATNHWAILDNARDPFNIVSRKLYPNANYAENSDAIYWGCDFLSTGVKIRNNWGASNEANKTYIFMAFAEQPFKFSNAR